MTALHPTGEQQDILDAVATGGTVAISACAGTGKTSTLRMIAERFSQKRMLYVAFNKAVQVEAASSFPRNVTCRTAHALAYRAFGARMAKRLDAPRRTGAYNASVLGAKSLVAGDLVFEPAAVATMAMVTVARFCRSADPAIGTAHFVAPEGLDAASSAPVAEAVVVWAQRAWLDLTAGASGRLKPWHDVYLKQWQLSGPHLNYDVVLYDECQPDGTEVWTLEDGHGNLSGRVGKAKIEDLKVGNRVLSYNRSGRLRTHGALVTGTSSRIFDGDLVTVSGPGNLFSRYTPNHLCIAVMGPAFSGRWVLYAMRRGQSWRIGVTGPRIVAKKRFDGAGRLHPVGATSRLREEDADAMWLLATFETRREALLAEDAASARWGLPQTVFKENRNGSASQARLDEFWASFGDLNASGERCLRAFNRDIKYPFFARSDDQVTYWRPKVVRASNLVSGMFMLDASEMLSRPRQYSQKETWVPVTVGHEPYVGHVWSMTVEPDHTYIADGFVTHNCQDADPCVADVVGRQAHAQLIAVGDSAQAIYGWRAAGDFLAAVPARHRLALTQSWRFGQAIADEANVWLSVIGAPVKVVGNPQRTSVLGQLGQADAVLCRSNAGTIDELLAAHANGAKVHLVGDGSEMLALAKAAQRMQEGHPSEHPELVAFPNWEAVRAYAEKDPSGSDLAVAVRMIDKYGAATVIEAIEGTVPAEAAELVVSTAHKAKGLEWPRVRVAGDFWEPTDPKSGRPLPIARDEAMLAYVAVTRAQDILDTGGLGWVRRHLDALGQGVPGSPFVTGERPADDADPSRHPSAAGGVALVVSSLLGRLEDLAGTAVGPLGELGADPIALARLERALGEVREALTAVAASTEKAVSRAGEICAVLRAALAEGLAHLCDQRGRPCPGWAGASLEAQGLRAKEGGGWEGNGVPMVCLPRHGALGVRGEDLRSLLRTGGVSWALAEASDRKLLAAVVSSGLVLDIGKRGAVASPMFKVGGQAVRLVLLAFDQVLPGETSGADDRPAAVGPAPVSAPQAGEGVSSAAPPEAHEVGPSGPPPDEVEVPTDEADVAVGEIPAGAGAPAASSTSRSLTGRKNSDAPDYSRSERYVYMAAQGLGLCDASGQVVYQHSHPWAHVGELVDAAREVAPRGELVIAVHPGAHHVMGLPERFPHEGDRPRLEFARAAMGPTTSVREIGSAGGLVVERHDAPRVLICFPGYSGEFAGAANAGELARALARFSTALGFGYAYSAASTVHKLIERCQPRGHGLGPPAPHPALEPPYLPTAWSVPAAAWSRALTEDERARPWLVVADRSGSYLSAWRSCPLAVGSWSQEPEQILEPGPESRRPCGYWLVEHAAVAALVPGALPDPFRRHGARPGALVWLTTPLVQLAAELAEKAGERLVVRQAWLSSERSRPLDVAATRLAQAREELAGERSPEAGEALAVIKEGYAAATAWFENGPQPPHPLGRPDWKRTIHDRFVANTWRSLARSDVPPVGLTDVDAALFPVVTPELPAGLRAGTGLGSWKLKGRALPMAEALDALEAAGPGAVVAMAESAS